MRLYADGGKGTYEQTRVGARGILISEGKILLAHERLKNYWCIPGGGWEQGETIEETCKREIAEEMGILVETKEEYITVESCWYNRIFENHFFLCRKLGETRKNQTAEEKKNDLTPEWVTLEEAKAIFSDCHDADGNGMWIGCYDRDRKIIELLMKDNMKRGM